MNEPKVLSLSAIREHDFVYYEQKDESIFTKGLMAALVDEKFHPTRHKFVVQEKLFDVCCYYPEDINYNKTWRCWSAMAGRPSKQDREAVKWDD